MATWILQRVSLFAVLTFILHAPIVLSSSAVSTPPTTDKMPPIILLKTTTTSTVPLRNALALLGYEQLAISTITRNSTRQQTYDTEGEKLFVELHWAIDDDFATLASLYPSARFILPVPEHPAESSRARKWARRATGASVSNLVEKLEAYQYAASVRNYFHDCNEETRLLEVKNGWLGDRSGDCWVQLCEFLGMGYSVVERMKLRKFPDTASAGGSDWKVVFQGLHWRGWDLRSR
ncbi:uncharacterized protein BDZ99DRAFT_517345 [Mytilinidion resinicola]|uniref:Uncharacterized protein n=1 Tax=Mytilinidion resinicola TaxID=574789 RepID=A0A6A6YYQ0_9PEZI|nr:uncharacterized protein BDZ99DRAFT_517345 [Mytilinidion resinicola]KAF2813055.1 hypothetical protein BDZ99DRAFT_517345 [Mytilinidion resinicola]